ncbi:RNA polymerase sigma-70 factor (ECF subfamily) [Luteimonas cucumeris]|uniref:RNA polymerase sigma-70 factor (ECF subfamily) n=1 Tax=Luteimonas cucumeris TaxID=985012 RepID=A0A562KWK3_9GAMM|nr:sigma-70 family RNA polymerase sigma factor [Luteimonas cucumeris]TWH99744.1 RNA polymerase sigma-70 factor (ECF subfamily) [Luteimonas cucumeris]
MSASELDSALREQLPALRRYARWLARDVHAADDLVQSALERAITRWDTRRDEQALRPWLFAIVYRRFIDGQRRARRYAGVLSVLGAVAEAQPSAEREVVARSTLQALAHLPVEQRSLLVWVSVEGLSYQEVADILGVPIGTVMSRLSRARAALRRISEGETVAPALRLLK